MLGARSGCRHCRHRLQPRRTSFRQRGRLGGRARARRHRIRDPTCRGSTHETFSARRMKRQERRIAMEAVHDQPAAASPASIRWKHQSLSRRTPPSSRQLVHTALSGPRDAYESTFESSFGVPASPAPPPEQFTWDPRGHSLESERSLESTPRAGRLAPAYEAWLNRKKAQVAPRDYPRSDIIRHHHPSIIDLHAERDPIRSTPGTPSRP